MTKLHFLSTETFLHLAYRLETGRRLNLEHPKTFNEKLNWLKLHGNTGKYAPLVDKLAVRPFVAKTIGTQYLVPLIDTYSRPEFIAWHELPKHFVVKCTHGSHCGIVCRDKATFDSDAAVKQLRKWLGRNWYWFGREPPYRGVTPRIIIEELLGGRAQASAVGGTTCGAAETPDALRDAHGAKNGDGITPPVDYKFMCFDGEPEVLQVHRKSAHGRATIDFFTAYGDRLPWRKAGYSNSSLHLVDRRKLRDMLPLARKLARATGAPYVRVDLYHEGDQVYFSELTFFDSAGFRGFEPPEVNDDLGARIHLEGRRKP